MIKVDMDNGKRYAFDDYDNYFVNDTFLVIEKGSAWVGCFELSHMVGFFVEPVDEQNVLHGVAICGRPVAKAFDDGETLEVTRLCTDGTPDACSMLYEASQQEWQRIWDTKR